MDQQPAPVPPTDQEPGQPVQLPQPVVPQVPVKSSRVVATIIILAVLLLGSAAFGYWQYQKNVSLVSQTRVDNEHPLTTTAPVNGNLQPGSTSTPDNYVTSTPPALEQRPRTGLCNNPGPVIASRSGIIQWQAAQSISNNIFTPTPGSANSDVYIGDNSSVVGHFTSGKYQGADLLVTELDVGYDYPGGSVPQFYHIIKQGNSYIVLNKYSDNLPDPGDIKAAVTLTEDGSFDLPDLDMPDTLHSTNPAADISLVSSLGAFTGSWTDFCSDGLVKVFTDPTFGDVYTDQPDTNNSPTGQDTYFMHGFYVKAPDGGQVTYQLDVPFVDQSGKTPLVTWGGGSKNSEDYSYQAIGGCGASQFLDVQNLSLSDLAQIGTTVDGQPVYGYKDPNADELTAMYGEIYLPDGQTKPSYAQFVMEHPIFFWQDPFGQFVRFKIMKYQPLAECAKPVIYLYPQQTEKISVQIHPLGGFLKTDPAYNGGWNVISDPQSNITNLADGQTYPYLFWEGRGGMYKTPNQGFVVAQSNVHKFLSDKLAQLGLNTKESSDFMDFWEPKMQGSPYYFVTFMGNNVMNQLAPISISPKPDTVIRILMDFRPLPAPIAVEGFSIRTPVRKGFTVVEWGGVLSAANQ